MDFSMTLTKEQEELKRKAHILGEEFKPHVQEWDRTNHAPIPEMTQRARELGLTGITMPKKYGGLDLSVLEYVIVLEELARTSQFVTGAEVLFRTSGPGPSVCMLSDNKAAKEKFLPGIVQGTRTAAITITEPNHGSAITDLETTATEDGDYFTVNGSKRFITGASEDELYSTFVRFKNIPGARGVGAIMIEKGASGVRVRRGPPFVGARGMPHGELTFRNARIPKENLLMPEGQFSRLMTAFNMERMHNGTLGLALSEAAFDEAKKYALSRKQFGTEIVDFQAIQHMLAEMWIEIEATRFLIYRAAATANDGKYPKGFEVSVAKAKSSDTVMKVTQMGILIHGGDGTTMGAPAQRLWRDAIILPIAGGTMQILKNVIAQWLVPERKLARPRGGEKQAG